jgi:hypothetical protein
MVILIVSHGKTRALGDLPEATLTFWLVYTLSDKERSDATDGQAANARTANLLAG